MTKKNELTHIDLFSGIGGFSLAAESCGFRTILFCEIDEFCQRVLKERFRGYVADSEKTRRQAFLSNGMGKKEQAERPSCIPIIPDIRDIDGTKWRGATLLTGGFPCQPFSVAGQRRGKEDNRHIWPEMFRVIKEARPRWVCGENVVGIVRMELDQVLADLENTGYSTQAIIIPACAKNAPHRRDRVWIIAHDERVRAGMEEYRSSGQRRQPSDSSQSEVVRQENGKISSEGIDTGSSNDAQVSLSSRNRGGNNGDSERSKCSLQTKRPSVSLCRDDSDSKTQRLQESRFKPKECQATEKNRTEHYDRINRYPNGIDAQGLWKKQNSSDSLGLQGGENKEWKENWLEVATGFCRVDDGLPSWIYSNRVKRLKALGNAIVPQVAQEIIKCIYQIEMES